MVVSPDDAPASRGGAARLVYQDDIIETSTARNAVGRLVDGRQGAPAYAAQARKRASSLGRQ